MSMKDEKTVSGDVVEERNGVYGGKWHIVSTEGFDIPEGQDYLKNSWEGIWGNYEIYGTERIHKYVASVKVSNITLAESAEELYKVLSKFHAYETNLEIENCTGDDRQSKHHYLEWLVYYAKNFSINGCQLKFKNLYCIICRMHDTSDGSYDLSGNVFISKKPNHFVKTKKWIGLIKKHNKTFKILDLRKCNFFEQEKAELIQEATPLNFLI